MDSESLASGCVSIPTNTRVRGSMAMRNRQMRRNAERMMEVWLQKEALSGSMTQLINGVPSQTWL